MTARIVVINGPPHCGKDTLGQFCALSYKKVINTKMAESLKLGAHALMGLEDAGVDRYEIEKDEPTPDFFNMTPREFYIKLAENFVKQHCGDEAFGYIWLRKNRFFMKMAKLLVITDCGFDKELQPILRHADTDEMCLIRLHRDGTDYIKDSRGYIQDVLPREADITNVNGTPEYMFNMFVKHMTRWGFDTSLEPKTAVDQD